MSTHNKSSREIITRIVAILTTKIRITMIITRQLLIIIARLVRRKEKREDNANSNDILTNSHTNQNQVLNSSNSTNSSSQE